MAGFKLGLGANSKVQPGNDSSPEKLNQIMSKIKGGIQVGRVTDIILNLNYPEINKFGGPNAIGTIFYELNNFIGGKEGVAKPLFPQTSAYPLVNEMVMVFKLPNNNIGRNTSDESYYYINMINLWNHPHHNAYPNPVTTTTLPESQQRDYQQTLGGAVRRVTDEETDINLNSIKNISQATFVERNDIHPLQPFAGDIIHEGRWSNSIRFGSTNKTINLGTSSNNWSFNGTTGDPITIIRNGQPSNSTDEGWKHITEKIQEDLSSIYLTSYQSIPLSPSSENYRSFNTPPTSVSLFTNPQIIFNSNRIVINAKTDSVLLSAQNSVNLSTNKSVNINTQTLSIDAANVMLGSKDAKESVVLGDTLHFQLNGICDALIQMLNILSVSQIWPNGIPTNDIEANTIYSSLLTQIKQIQEYLPEALSKNVKTI
jgi:hypothetical protein